MCHYIQKVRNVEILQMRVEFLKDENGNLWFVHAKDIHTRKKKDKLTISGQGSKRIADALANHQQRQHDNLTEELAEYEVSVQPDPATKYQRFGQGHLEPKNEMLSLMEDYYETLKTDIGIDPTKKDDGDDPGLDVMLKSLKANSTAANFKDFMTRSQNLHKSTPWK